MFHQPRQYFGRCVRCVHPGARSPTFDAIIRRAGWARDTLSAKMFLLWSRPPVASDQHSKAPRNDPVILHRGGWRGIGGHREQRCVSVVAMSNRLRVARSASRGASIASELQDLGRGAAPRGALIRSPAARSPKPRSQPFTFFGTAVRSWDVDAMDHVPSRGVGATASE